MFGDKFHGIIRQDIRGQALKLLYLTVHLQ